MGLRLYAATTSQGKLRDFRTAADAYSIAIDPFPRSPPIPAPEENGATFAANATLKAVYYSRFAPGQLVLADDSGLEVDALTARPECARRALPPTPACSTRPTPTTTPTCGTTWCCCSGWRTFPQLRRTARYRCVLVAARDGLPFHTAHGSVEGLILEAPRGTGGFGYDPLFYLPELDCTMAELDLETKLSLSHRGRAFQALLVQLR